MQCSIFAVVSVFLVELAPLIENVSLSVMTNIHAMLLIGLFMLLVSMPRPTQLLKDQILDRHPIKNFP